MGRRAWRDLTIRTQPVPKSYVLDIAKRLEKRKVVIHNPKTGEWKRGKLIGIDPVNNRFRIRLINDDRIKILVGIWRIHYPDLFTPGRLPRPRKHATVLNGTKNNPNRRGRMATKATTKKGRGTKAASKAKSTNGGTRSADLLEDYTDAQRRKLAKAIVKMKKQGAKWGEIGEELELPGERPSVVGRRLLREYADDGEEFIRERDMSGSSKKSTAKASGTKSRGRKAAAADDEDDDDEDDAPPKRKASGRASKKKVTVKRGKGKTSNP